MSPALLSVESKLLGHPHLYASHEPVVEDVGKLIVTQNKIYLCFMELEPRLQLYQRLEHDLLQLTQL